MIGLRDWEKTPKNCDIFEVYGPAEVEQLKMIPYVGFNQLRPIIESTNVSSSDPNAASEIEFTTNNYSIDDTPIEEETFVLDESGEQINFDDKS